MGSKPLDGDYRTLPMTNSSLGYKTRGTPSPLPFSSVPFLSQYLRMGRAEKNQDGFHSPISHPYKHLRHPDKKGPAWSPGRHPTGKSRSLLWLWKDEVTMSSALPELSRRQRVLLKGVLKNCSSKAAGRLPSELSGGIRQAAL